MAEAEAAQTLQQKKASLNKAGDKRKQFLMPTFSSPSMASFLLLSKKQVLFCCNRANTNNNSNTTNNKMKKKKSLEKTFSRISQMASQSPISRLLCYGYS